MPGTWLSTQWSLLLFNMKIKHTMEALKIYDHTSFSRNPLQTNTGLGMHCHLESPQMNSVSELNTYSTANAKTRFPYLNSFQEKGKIMTKWRYWNISITQDGKLFCSDKLPSSYHHFGVFAGDLFSVISTQRSLCCYNGFLTGSSQTILSH